jgi:hypothetical protein
VAQALSTGFVAAVASGATLVLCFLAITGNLPAVRTLRPGSRPVTHSQGLGESGVGAPVLTKRVRPASSRCTCGRA